MKAIVYREIGDPSVLKLIERDIPEPGPGEVRVRVHASGVNPTDWRARSTAAWGMYFPEVTPHHDGGGVIDAVGADVETFAPGDRVWVMEAALGYNTGTAHGERVVRGGRVARGARDHRAPGAHRRRGRPATPGAQGAGRLHRTCGRRRGRGRERRDQARPDGPAPP